jgi:hypothetical protein
VRIFGTDAHGKIFSESVSTVDVSQDGAQLAGVQAELKNDEIIGLTYAQKKVHFRVKWIGKPGTPMANRVGLLNLTPEKPLWEMVLPKPAQDQYKWQSGDRRKFPRIRVVLSVELQPEGGAPIWANSADLSEGGCFVEMAIPLKQGQKLKVGLWIDGAKMWVHGEVVSSTPGFGIGIKFLDLSESDKTALKNFLQKHKR